MKFIRITRDLWINLEEAESIIRNDDGTATIQLRSNVWQSEIPFEAVIVAARDSISEDTHMPSNVRSPLLVSPFDTHPAW